MHEEILLPRADGALDSYVPVGEPVDIAPTAPSRAASLTRRHMWSATRWRTTTRPSMPTSTGRRRSLQEISLVARALRRRGHGHSPNGMGLGWETSRELIRRSIAEARVGGDLASGAGRTTWIPQRLLRFRR